MPRLRRFQVESLEGVQPGATIELAPEEARHVRVLRLEAGARVELCDAAGRAFLGELDASGRCVKALEEAAPDARASRGPRLVLATAWPKGKRAAVLVEKCAELGVHAIVPLQCERGVVKKGEDSEGLARLRRIAAEAAKQSGRRDAPEIGEARTLDAALDGAPSGTLIVLLDPRAEISFSEVLAQKPTPSEILCLVGPEGGFTPEETRTAAARGAQRARLGPHVLRVETACIAACAVAAAGPLRF